MDHEPSGIEQVTVALLPDGRMTRKAAARYIGVACQTLAIWAGKGVGPEPIRVRGRVFYRKTDIDNFISGAVA